MAERNKMLAYMFLDGADKTMFGYLVKNMGNDYALGNDTYPEDVESALQVLLLYQEGGAPEVNEKEEYSTKRW